MLVNKVSGTKINRTPRENRVFCEISRRISWNYVKSVPKFRQISIFDGFLPKNSNNFKKVFEISSNCGSNRSNFYVNKVELFLTKTWKNIVFQRFHGIFARFHLKWRLFKYLTEISVQVCKDWEKTKLCNLWNRPKSPKLKEEFRKFKMQIHLTPILV